MFGLRMLIEKYSLKELHFDFEVERAYDRILNDKQWYCMRKFCVAEYIRLVQDMYESIGKVVRCAVGVMDGFKVEVGQHPRLVLSPFLFTMVMDRLIDEVRQESPWKIMFPDDIVICSESGEQVEENTEEVEICGGKKRNESQS